MTTPRHPHLTDQPPAGPTTAGAPGPGPVSTRALGPDLARGFMLLFIALANSHYFLNGASVLGGYPQDGSALDRAVTWLIATFVDGRAFPMFGLLFGYGVARIAHRQEALGPRAVRRLLWRRGIVLVVVGFLHAVLLYVGDILAAYGVLLFAGAWLVRRRDRWLLSTALFFFLLGALPGAGSLTISTDPPHVSMLPPDPLSMVLERAPVSLYVALLGPLGFACPFALGLWAGRRRVLEQPQRHRRLLRGTAVAGIGAAVLGAQPISLILAGVLAVPDRATLELLGPLHDATGLFGGLGYAALLSLIAARLQTRHPRPVVDAIAATGQRSMTCYLAQSIVWAVAFTPFLLDLSGTLTVAGTALLAATTWLGTVLLADWMRRTGRRGPFEVLIRRVTYRQPPG
ncbi:DUF418 domain-containing protein [Plantactinospora veratri]|uniref:DUF418 domain-containing protein n=1 Tax=Plantactinospora veratri TaxID=1436122 RepID=A0ABU7SBH7_9ACTN